MNKVLVLCGIVILFVLCITLVVFAPKRKRFFEDEERYSKFIDCLTDAQKELILSEIDENDWVDAPDDWKYTKKTEYKTIRLYSEYQAPYPIPDRKSVV